MTAFYGLTWSASAGPVAVVREIAPVFVLDFDAELFRGAANPLPCFVALGIAYIFDLIEARDGVPDMSGVVQRLFIALECGLQSFTESLLLAIQRSKVLRKET